MSLGNLFGHARVSTRNPSAAGICDRCNFVYQHSRLSPQFQWGGAKLFDEGYLVCRRCLDKPQDQFRSLILPGDPQPVINPRPDFWQTPPTFLGSPVPTTPGNQGFSQYVLTLVDSEPGASQIGVNYPLTKFGALASLAAISRVPTPAVIDRSIVLTRSNIAAQVLAANPARAFLALYSPVTAPTALNLGTALWGLTTNLMIGPGEAWFWATAQGLGAAYQGAIQAISLTPSQPLWVWEA